MNINERNPILIAIADFMMQGDPENNGNGGEWYAMARSHCAELKRKYGVDFTEDDAAAKTAANFDKLFAAFRSGRVEGYRTALKTLGAYDIVSIDGYHIEPPPRKGHTVTYSPDGWHIEYH